jgi:hypothetical protein
MLKKVTIGLAALAVAGFATSAMAVTPGYGPAGSGQYYVGVNIQVDPVVSLWANDNNIQLTMNGADGNNSATAASSLSVINNVDANVTAKVDGTLAAPTVPGGGMNFFIFNGGTPTDAVNAITANAYNPAGALAWNSTTINGPAQTLIPSTGVNTSISNRPIVYAASAPGEIPLPNSYDLTVTYTITANP